MSLVNEAVLEAKQLVDLAVSNAKIALEENFQPRIQRMISSKLAEEDDEFEDEETGLEPEAPVANAPVDAPAAVAAAPEVVPAEPVTPAEPVATGAVPQEPVAPLVDVPGEEEEENDDAALEALIRELNGEEDAPELELDDLELEHFISKIKEEDEFSDEPVPTMEKVNYRSEYTRLKNENAQLAKANLILRNAINEATLLSTKLMYSIKVGRQYGLNESQSMDVFKAFDRAKTIEEAKLVFATLQESMKAKTASNGPAVQPRKSPVVESLGSRSTTAVRPAAPQKTEYSELRERFAVLSGRKRPQ